MRNSYAVLFTASSMLVASVRATVSYAQITVTNMIPREWSWETYHNSEPHLALNRAQARWLTAAAWMHDEDWCQGSLVKPLFRTVDRGRNWQTYCALPVGVADARAGDITLAYSPTGGRLYAAYLSPIGGESGSPALRMRVSRTSGFYWHLGFPMQLIHDRDGGDQPSIEITRVRDATFPGVFREYAYVGNFYGSSPADYSTAIVDFLPRANFGSATSTGTFNGYELVNLNARDISYDPGTRLATHPNGTVFAAFYRGYSSDVTGTKKDVVVAAAAPGHSLFNAISEEEEESTETDPCQITDGLPGARVERCVTVPFDFSGTTFGFQRLAQTDISIAVGPWGQQPEIVYVAWADGSSIADYAIHVRRSTDGGLSWEEDDVRKIKRATNPALALDHDGTVGFLYQQLTRSCDDTGDRWITRLELSKDGFDTEPATYILANVPANEPSPQGHPYIGDYLHLDADKGRFYGVFSTSNEPIMTRFPQGVTYLRNADWSAGKLREADGSGDVKKSLDPFFFTLRTAEALGCTAVRNAQTRVAQLGWRPNISEAASRLMTCIAESQRGVNLVANFRPVDFTNTLTSLGC